MSKTFELRPSMLVGVEYVEGDHYGGDIRVSYADGRYELYVVHNIARLEAHCKQHHIPFVRCGFREDKFSSSYIVEGEKAAVEVKIADLMRRWPPSKYQTTVRTMEYIAHRKVWEAWVWRSE